MSPECPLNVPWMFPECSLSVLCMFPECSVNVPWTFSECSLEALCDWTRSSTPGIRRLVLLSLVLGTHVCELYSASTLVLFFKCFLQLGWGLTGVQLNSNWMFPERSLNVPWMYPECSLNVPWMFPECFWMFPDCRSTTTYSQVKLQLWGSLVVGVFKLLFVVIGQVWETLSFSFNFFKIT
jgi:hypothetical protein